jgi:hypothetical protein
LVNGLNIKEYLDTIFIIHKIEGRTFLMGRNGFYNKIYEMFSKRKNSFFFILIFKQLNRDEMHSYIQELIQKGDQSELKMLYENEQIICVEEDNIEEDLIQLKDKLDVLLFKKFLLFNYTNKDYLKLLTENEKDLLSKVIASFKKPKSKCNIL